MTVEEAYEALLKVDVGQAYPGLVFTVHPPQPGDVGVGASIVMNDRPDADGVDAEPAKVGNCCVLSGYELRSINAPLQIAEIVRHRVLDLLAHELDEWFRYDGKRLREPHP